jgi:hydrophobic/amphiphilic exporter-1 (mainly G- bacteria), HAE1 family
MNASWGAPTGQSGFNVRSLDFAPNQKQPHGVTGDAATLMRARPTTPIEEQVNGVEGMAYISSVSANDGSSSINVTFDVGYPVDIGAVDVLNRESQAAAQLPQVVQLGGVTISKQNPIMAVNVYSPDGSISPVTVSNYSYLQLVDPLERLPGVSSVTIFGERRYAIRVWLDPLKMAKLGITTTDVQNAILEQSLQVAAGKVGEAPAPAGTQFEYQINAQGQLTNPQQFGNIVLRAATPNAAALYLRDVARTDLGAMQCRRL